MITAIPAVNPTVTGLGYFLDCTNNFELFKQIQKKQIIHEIVFMNNSL